MGAGRRGAGTRPGGRRRLPAEAARRAILEAAEKRLVEGGPDAVRVQVIAADLGLSDAALHHHFGNRRGLLVALLSHAGRRLRDEIGQILSDAPRDPAGLRRIAERIAECYAERGAARLALWLSLSGWKPTGAGMFAPLVDAVHAARGARARARGTARPRREDAQRAVALLNLALAAEPLLGGGFLRSVGLSDATPERARFRAWLVRELEGLLSLP